MSDTTQITRFGLVNCYLVREADGLTLIDTALPRSAKRIIHTAAALGAPIVRIVLTHAHMDHIGSLDSLHWLLPDAEVIISAREERLLVKDMTMDPGEPEGKLRGGYPGADTPATRTVNAGDRVGSLEVFATPGHTPGHISLLDTRDRTLICGDAFTTVGGVATTAKGPLVFPFASSATWSRETELESARALCELEPSRLAPGHGRIVESPVAAMRAALDRGI